METARVWFGDCDSRSSGSRDDDDDDRRRLLGPVRIQLTAATRGNGGAAARSPLILTSSGWSTEVSKTDWEGGGGKKKRQKNACDEEDGVRIKKKGAELHKNPWAIGLVQFVNLNF